MKKITKAQLTKLIFKRLGGSVSKSSIYDAINIINDSLINMIMENKPISIDNFGTFSPFMFHKHNGLNISSGKIQNVKQLKIVKFRTHSVFQELIDQKKDKFKKAKG
jgi:nucleoid DNA-binding protein